MHVGIRGSVNDHEDITADAELVSGIRIVVGFWLDYISPARYSLATK